jgi:hypothetical protein
VSYHELHDDGCDASGVPGTGGSEDGVAGPRRLRFVAAQLLVPLRPNEGGNALVPEETDNFLNLF